MINYYDRYSEQALMLLFWWIYCNNRTDILSKWRLDKLAVFPLMLFFVNVFILTFKMRPVKIRTILCQRKATLLWIQFRIRPKISIDFHQGRWHIVEDIPELILMTPRNFISFSPDHWNDRKNISLNFVSLWSNGEWGTTARYKIRDPSGVLPKMASKHEKDQIAFGQINPLSFLGLSVLNMF